MSSNPAVSDPVETLINATIAMHKSGRPLMQRVLPGEGETVLWEHYPEDDAISPSTGARFFYHCHPVEERGEDEHGHFHLFLPKSAFPRSMRPICAPPNRRKKRANVVHIISLSVDPNGIPIELFTINRWVTDEWMYRAGDIAQHLDQFDLTDAPYDKDVCAWLTAAITLARPNIIKLLEMRDALLASNDWDGEQRELEILSREKIDLQSLIEG